MSDYIDKVDIEGVQYDIQDTETKQTAEQNTQDIQTMDSDVEALTNKTNLVGTVYTVSCSSWAKNTQTGHFAANVSGFLPKGTYLATVKAWGHQYTGQQSYLYNPVGLGFMSTGWGLSSGVSLFTISADKTNFTFEQSVSTDQNQPSWTQVVVEFVKLK